MVKLLDSEVASILYHDIFDYPLDSSQLKKWKVGMVFGIRNKEIGIEQKDGFYFKKGREYLIKQRLQNEKYSKAKLLIANKASKIISLIPSVYLIALTGSLAMENANKNSDIDLMVVTKSGDLWTTRLLTYLLLIITNLKVRSSQDKNQKDKLCLNIWMDESNLEWDKNDRNIYTAHEILQIVPLVNKYNVYEKLIDKNLWVGEFWPKVLLPKKRKDAGKWKINNEGSRQNLLEKACYWIQVLYMKQKISREIVRPDRAIFHPNDIGKKILKRLSS